MNSTIKTEKVASTTYQDLLAGKIRFATTTPMYLTNTDALILDTLNEACVATRNTFPLSYEGHLEVLTKHINKVMKRLKIKDYTLDFLTTTEDFQYQNETRLTRKTVVSCISYGTNRLYTEYLSGDLTNPYNQGVLYKANGFCPVEANTNSGKPFDLTFLHPNYNPTTKTIITA